MKKSEISIAIGRESTQEEFDFVKNIFLDDFQFEIRDDLVRLSAGDLPMVIMINILTGLVTCMTYDLLKIAVKKILTNKQVKRKASVVIQEEDVQYIISEKYIAIRKQAKDTKFESVDDLFDFLCKKNSK